MSFVRTLVLAILAAAVGAYIWLVEAPRMEREALPERLLDVSLDDIATVDLSYPRGGRIHIRREGPGWQMTEPVSYPADTTVVENLLRSVEELEVERTLETDEALELSNYGLDGTGTQARVALTLTDGTELPAIVVGRTTPVGTSAFARLENGERVVLTPLLFHSTVRKTPFDLREKHLFDLDTRAVLAIELTAGETDVRIERRGDDWHFTSPFQDRADTAAMGSLLNAANDGRAEAFADGDDVDRGALGLAEPFLSIGYQLGGGRTVSLTLGAEPIAEAGDGAEGAQEGAKPTYWIERGSDGQVARVPEWIAGRFTKHPNELRDRHVFRCDAASAHSIRFERSGEAPFELYRSEDGSWTATPAAERPVSRAAADRVLRGLAELLGEAIVADVPAVPSESLTEYGLESALVEVTVTLPDGKSCSAATSTPEPDSESPNYYFRRDERGAILSGQSHQFSRFDFTLADFLERERE